MKEYLLKKVKEALEEIEPSAFRLLLDFLKQAYYIGRK